MARRRQENSDGTNFLSADQTQLLADTSIPQSDGFSSSDGPVRECLELGLSILGSCTAGTALGCDMSWSESVLERLIGILPNIGSIWTEDWEALQVLTLQLYLNLTNGVPRLCSLFARSKVVDASFDIVEAFFKRVPDHIINYGRGLLDREILAFGCLINFAEGRDTMRALVLQQTGRGQSILQVLLDLFLENSSRAAEVSFWPSRLVYGR